MQRTVDLRFALLSAALSVCCSLFVGLTVHAQGVDCAVYGSGASVPQGFGLPWNPLSTERELLIGASCDTSSATFSALGTPSWYVYKSGYYWTGAQWVPFSFPGDGLVSGAWYTGTVRTSVPYQGQTTYAVAYLCGKVGNTWKCGCQDASCTVPAWQIQAARRESGAPSQYTLTVSRGGTGAGTVNGTGIACGADCTETYSAGTTVTLTASPQSGSTFAGWSGDCTGTGSCAVVANKNLSVTATFTTPSSGNPSGMRAVPDPIYGVTVDDVANVNMIVNSSRALSRFPTTRIVFDEGVAASYYVNAVNALQPVSYIMGELLDSVGLRNITVDAYKTRTASYLATLGSKVDIWEVGNEVNGNWTGPYSSVGSKIYEAHKLVKAAGKRSALTLWYNDRCGNGPSELDPIAFSRQYVPADMRTSLDYVWVSYYETQCNNIRPTAAHLTTFFNELRTLYPNAKLGFGEVGFPNKVGSNLEPARSMLNYYYGLDLNVPGYVGGYFWWYYYQDMLPHTTKPLWQDLNRVLQLY